MAAKRDMGAGSDGIFDAARDLGVFDAARDLGVFDAARDLGVVRRVGGQTHLETLIIYMVQQNLLHRTIFIGNIEVNVW